MNRRVIPMLLILLAPCRVLADTSAVPPPLAGQLCRQAIAAAERAHGIPSRLLAAIARVESGRRDQASGSFNPWPWTINVDGQGSFYDSKGQAVAAALSERQHAAKSIDVGCMQISLTYHPDAFASMDQAFDPASNTDYGARFLLQLFEKTNSWPKAVELYHSATPGLGEEYQHQVYAAWPVEQKLAEEEPLSPGVSTLMAHTPALSWAPPFSHGMFTTAFRPTAPRVITPPPDIAGGSAPGRTLASYRAAPVRLAFRAP